MEAILARALEYTLKYWLKSFSRDQFKLHGRRMQLSNLDINGDGLHASMGLPPALSVTKANIDQLEIILPYVSNVQIEPIVLLINKLDLVLKENCDLDTCNSSNSTHSLSSSSKGSGYGFADKIADGMTIQVSTLNLLLEMRGGVKHQGTAAWAIPLASITICNLSFYTTNENWKVVNLKDARDFSLDKNFIYLFKKLEWGSLSIDLLPHPDMFADPRLARSKEGGAERDDDGAKRVLFGGERFLEGITGAAYITVQRNEQNRPLGLEVQMHITEAVCPALSEPGLRALLRFLMGLYICLNRGDVDIKGRQLLTEAAGRSMVLIMVDHIFLGIKDTEFQLDLLVQSLFFSRATVSDEQHASTLTTMRISGFFLRDTFSRPPCSLVQPSMQQVPENVVEIPSFAKNFCPPIYPLGHQQMQFSTTSLPLISFHSHHLKPSPIPPSFSMETVIACQPLMFHFQEDLCLRIASFLADGIVPDPGDVSSTFSMNSMSVFLKGLDLTVPMKSSSFVGSSCFNGANLHIENLSFSESPLLKMKLLNLEKDPACFSLWDDQPINASQKKWTGRLSCLTVSLETSMSFTRLYKCVEIEDASIDVAMVSADGSPLISVPPPGGVVRVAVACHRYSSKASVGQLFFALELYTYLGLVGERLSSLISHKREERCCSNGDSACGMLLMDRFPCDTSTRFKIKEIRISFLEFSENLQASRPLIQLVGDDLFVDFSHRTLGGALAISSNLCWRYVEVNCVELEGGLLCPQLRTILRVHNDGRYQAEGGAAADTNPFVDIHVTQVIPIAKRSNDEYHSFNIWAYVSNVHLGGGMNYTEALLRQIGIFGPDGGSPGIGFSKGLANLLSGPLAKLFKASSPLGVDDVEGVGGSVEGGKDEVALFFGMPNDVDVHVELKEWLIALEGPHEKVHVAIEERCWLTTFHSLIIRAKGNPKDELSPNARLCATQQYPVQSIMIGIEGLQMLKPRRGKLADDAQRGLNFEISLVLSDDDSLKWVAESFKFSVKQPIEAAAAEEEIQHLASLFKSEANAAGRIVAGVLRLLNLEHSIRRSAMDKLSNLGSESIHMIFSPENASTSHARGNLPAPAAESTIASLEEAVGRLQNRCSQLASSSTSGSQPSMLEIEQFHQQLEMIQSLIVQLRSQFS